MVDHVCFLTWPACHCCIDFAKRVILFNVAHHLYVVQEETFLDQMFSFLAVQIPVTNQTNITQSKVDADFCGGVSSYTNWLGYLPGTQGIYTIVSTTDCSFNTTPLYYISIQGKKFHTDFTGYNNIYRPTRNEFTFLIYSHQGFSAEQLLNYSQIEQWNISWIGAYQ